MPILDRCWTPHVTRPWTSVKYGSYYTAVYSTLFHVATLGFVTYNLIRSGSETTFGLYDRLSPTGSIALSATIAIFCICILVASALLIYGIRLALRLLFLPWMICMFIEIIVLAALGISFIATAYSMMYPIIMALILWCFDAFHLYCLLCVVSQYQVLKDHEEPRFVILNQ